MTPPAVKSTVCLAIDALDPNLSVLSMSVVFSAFTLAYSLFEIPPDTDRVLLRSTESAREGREEYLKRPATHRGEIGALDVSKMKEMFDTNVFGLVDLTNRIVPAMKERGEGTSSTSRPPRA